MTTNGAEQFLDECGWLGALRIEIEGTERRHDGPGLELFQPFAIIGRAATSDVTLVDQDVSRHHAYLQVVDGRIFCVDLRSRTGVYWQDGRRPCGWIAPGSAVRIGSSVVRPWGGHFDTRGPKDVPDSLPTSSAFGIPSADDVVLESLDRSTPPAAWNASRSVLLIGRSPSCKVSLPDPQCASMHASLVRTPGGIWVVDLGSSYGTLVNGVAVRCARLVDGDELGLGSQRLRLNVGPSATRILSYFSLPARRSSPDTATDRRETRELSHAERQPSSSAVSSDQALIMELLREMSRQQSETAEQFRQVAVMLYRMHQDQMDVITGELERLGRLIERRPGAPCESTVARPVAGDPPTGTASSSSIDCEAPPVLIAPAGSGRESATPPSSVTQASSVSVDSAPWDPEGDYHLLLARRLAAARKADQGRLKLLMGWLRADGRSETGA